ncbi:high-affinity nickel-transport protein [Tardiphaga sp. OK246]|jgi:high-affinity nickel-transport protein|uniref:Nickel/cobalt efflux system n=1 Tax=Tardiphaga robiniae TaxID=943830 RepID=A0A7G6U6A0_9BRAD|nr:MULTISPECIES: HoxN/HupN/NixA family nickel/cobalt transporter [Tardiphaga]MDR6662553.1 high-affinity nickel-transport protein [Tardiphaga robiniae]QND74532.1 HoxN/HupN/NixA family nickel/cobalt transporter [Tardiphaga robiniae]SNS42863.1 high-affinity nickel-transport protein [Tardiphaga sp. OK246]
MIRTLFNDGADNLRGRIIAIYAILIPANVLAWIWALVAFRDQPVLLGTALLAYTFGLRHAVDADHIAAIDNVTRKLMQSGKRPLSVGLFFSLGHSTVVVVASIFVALAVSALQEKFADFKEIGGLIGTSVSAFFLLIVAVANIFILVSVYRLFKAVKRGERFIDEDLNVLLSQRGVIGRMLRSVFAVISKSWHMYPLGILFGLGFDTATEIALLGISASQSADGMSMWSILVFPALFTAGMSLVDATDSVLMVRAYGWAFVKPIRKLYYNMIITLVSVIVALVIGGVEALGLIGRKLDLSGSFWDGIEALNENFGALGYLIIAIFILSWMISVIVYRVKGYDDIEVRVHEA